jgi:hypothetical protein
MEILIACESSGIVANAFNAPGFNVYSCDFLENDSYSNHLRINVEIILSHPWDVIIGFPPCTYLCKAQIPLHKSSPERYEKSLSAAFFFKKLFNHPAKYIALENPPGMLNNLFRPADQIIHPNFFGSRYKKQTGLWLKGLPPLIYTGYHPSPVKNDNKINSSMSAALRSKKRSTFFPEVARAMFEQWAPIIRKK